jgi:signal transduction histidine kinase/DNA-binding response OmpR family regulator
MSLKIQITLALLLSSLLALLAVGWLANLVVTGQFSDQAHQRAFENYQGDVVAYYQVYGSWQAATQREHLTAFITRRRHGENYSQNPAPERDPLQPALDNPQNIVQPLPKPLPAGGQAASAGGPPPNADGNGGPPPPKGVVPRPKNNIVAPILRFTLVDEAGITILPAEESGKPPKQVVENANWRANAEVLRLNGQVIAYGLPEGQAELSQAEQNYLIALNRALTTAGASTVPFLLLAGWFWGSLLTRPLKQLTKAAQAMQQGVLEQTVKVQVNDEIGELTGSFNAMSQRLAKAYHELERAKDLAEAASRAKSNFLSNMSHELRTPLNAIIGFARLLQRSAGFNGEQIENLAIIGNSGEHLLQLINSVLSISKIEAGKIEVQHKAFDLVAMLNTLMTMFAFDAEGRGLHFELEITEAVPQYLVSDEAKLKQILINLVGNALKFTQQGGIGLLVDYREQRLQIAVHDSGVGIAAHEQDKLFVAFEQTESGKNAQSGTGLGLALCKHFVELLGGQLRVQSVLGEGSTFSFAIPAAPSEAIAAPPTEPGFWRLADPYLSDPPRILVVDDRFENRKLLCRLLDLAGFASAEASDGLAAVRRWREWQPALIWMDVRMPGMDGFAATREIQAAIKAGGSPTVIIALTASVFEEDEAKVLAQGFDDFVRKPFQQRIIFEKIAQYLGVRYQSDTESAGNVGNTGTNNTDTSASQQQQAQELWRLGPKWPQTLTLACQEADYFALQRLLAEATGAAPALAPALRALLIQYDYAAMQALLARLAQLTPAAALKQQQA